MLELFTSIYILTLYSPQKDWYNIRAYNIHMESKPQLKLSHAIRFNRSVKEFAREDKLYASGGVSKELTHILELAHEATDRLESAHRTWLVEKKAQIAPYLGEIPEDQVRDNYELGLNRFIKQEYKVIKKYDPDKLKELSDPVNIEDSIRAYTFDFWRSMRVCQRLRIEPTMAIRIAQKSYMHDPNEQIKLRREFPQFQPWVITATVAQKRDPRASLTELDERITRLKTVYDDFSEGEIVRIAFGHTKDPDSYMQHLQRIIPELQVKYPDFPESSIRQIALLYEDPDTVLKLGTEKLPALAGQFPNLSKTVISSAIINRPSGPEKFLQYLSEELPKMKAAYPEFEEGELIKIMLGHARGSIADYMKRVIQTSSDLKEQFPEFGQLTIQGFVIDNENPRERLTQVRERIAQMSTEYPDISRWIIISLCERYKDPNVPLKRFMQLQPALLEQFPEFSDHLISKVVMSRKDPESFLKEVRRQIPILQEEFPEFTDIQIAVAMETSSVPRTYLGEVRRKVSELQGLYPEVPGSILTRAVIGNVDYREYMKRFKEHIDVIAQRHPWITPSIAMTIAVEHPRDPEGFIQEVREVIPTLRQEFPYFDLWIINTAAIESPRNAAKTLQRVQRDIVSLRERYPEYTERSLYYAALHFPNNPEGFLKTYRR